MNAHLDILQSLSERVLTEQVVVPLFQNLGYESVEYSHGADEAGKDLIAWRESEIGEIELMVASGEETSA